MSPTNLLSLVKLFCIATDPRLQRGFCDLLSTLIKTKSCILSEWARASLCFSAFIKKVSRLFRNKNCSFNLEPKILDWILPRFDCKKYIPILIDPSFVPNRYLGALTKTSSDQKEAKKGFFLFSASLPVKGRAISFFQFCYRYSQIGWGCYESINTMLGLQLLKISRLLEKYTTKAVFILDRGFGYEYFLKKLTELKNHFVVRVRDPNTHVTLMRTGTYQPIKNLIQRVSIKEPLLFKVKYKATIHANLLICKKIINNKLCTWALLTDLDNPNDIIDLYKQRMKIEETFKDWKSTGFNIEKLQIKQWDVLPKLIWCVVLAHLILYLLGETLSKSKSNKNYFKCFIQKQKNLSLVQFAWKTWLYDPQKIPPILHSLLSTLLQNKETL